MFPVREDHDGFRESDSGTGSLFCEEHLPKHVKSISAEGIAHVKLIDASPIGINVRSTVATYANIHDELRKIYAKTADAKNRKYKAGIFLQYWKAALPGLRRNRADQSGCTVLPDVDIPCPECGGSRYAKGAWQISYENKQETGIPCRN